MTEALNNNNNERRINETDVIDYIDEKIVWNSFILEPVDESDKATKDESNQVVEKLQATRTDIEHGDYSSTIALLETDFESQNKKAQNSRETLLSPLPGDEGYNALKSVMITAIQKGNHEESKIYAKVLDSMPRGNIRSILTDAEDKKQKIQTLLKFARSK